MNYSKQIIKRKLQEWWDDDKTCSGKPECCINNCDLCFNCFDKLCKKFNLYLDGLTIKEITK